MTKNLSIKQIFAQANKAILLFAVIPLLLSILLYSQQLLIYQQTIANIQKGDAIALKVDQKVLESMWDLISGQVTVDEFNEENILEELRNDIREIKNNTNTLKEISTLDVSLRTIDTLEDYQNELINNILAKDFMDTNEEIINQVDSVTQLLSDILQDFVRVEIDLASKKNTTLVRSLILLTIVELGVLSTIFFYAKKNRRFLERKVQEPINQLIEMSEQLSSGNLGFRLTLPETLELQTLTASMNKMAEDLNQSLRENALKQYHLAQSEVRVLQAQITPHFIYNSLDAIISLIEQDWIPLEKEISHINDYLVILKIRYGHMLDYKIDIPETLFPVSILKMILQPLIENAVYHGTKYVRHKGFIRITACKIDEMIQFKVTDNGIGIPAEKLAEIRKQASPSLLRK